MVRDPKEQGEGRSGEMRFTYIYRDASGAKQAGEIEAEDRAD